MLEMLISAFTDTWLKSKELLANALWTNMNKQWTTVFLFPNINKD